MDAFTLMKRDHRNIRKLLQKIETINKPAEKEKLFGEAKKELEAHVYMEENSFYPGMRQAKTTHDITLESYEKHHVIKIFIQELTQIEAYQEEWMTKFHILKKYVENHIQEEEDDFFPKAKKILGTKSKELGKEMEKMKNQYKEYLK